MLMLERLRAYFELVWLAKGAVFGDN